MYSTKSISAKAKSFTNTQFGYLSEKEKYTDPDRVVPGRWKGKQLIAPGPKKPAGVSVGYFDKFTYTPETYVDRSLYTKTQPIESRKLGFGSHNAKCRDEFMSHIRTEQYRSQLRAEAKTTEKGVEASSPTGAGAGADTTVSALTTAGGDIATTLRFPKRSGFDVARDDRSPRSVYNVRGIKKGERDLGTATLTSGSIGAGLDTVALEKPEHSITEACKRFYHSGHLGEL